MSQCEDVVQSLRIKHVDAQLSIYMSGAGVGGWDADPFNDWTSHPYPLAIAEGKESKVGGWRTAGAICRPELTPTLSRYTAGRTTSCPFRRPPLPGLPDTHAEP